MSIPKHVLCLNCEEMIPLSEASVHSFSCCYVLPEVLYGSLENTKTSLVKFDRFLEELQEKETVQSFEDLGRISKGLLTANRAEEVHRASAELEEIGDSNTSSTFFIIALQRLKKLSKDLEFHISHTEVNRRKAEIGRMKIEIELYKERAKSYRKELSSNDKFSTVIQGIDSRGVSPQESLNVSMDDGEMSIPHIEQATNEAAAESLKTYFFVKYIAIKLAFKRSHKAHKVSADSLYNEAISKQIPIDNWPEFIKSQLENAEQRGRNNSWARFEPKVVIQEETE